MTDDERCALIENLRARTDEQMVRTIRLLHKYHSLAVAPGGNWLDKVISFTLADVWEAFEGTEREASIQILIMELAE